MIRKLVMSSKYEYLYIQIRSMKVFYPFETIGPAVVGAVPLGVGGFLPVSLLMEPLVLTVPTLTLTSCFLFATIVAMRALFAVSYADYDLASATAAFFSAAWVLSFHLSISYFLSFSFFVSSSFFFWSSTFIP